MKDGADLPDAWCLPKATDWLEEPAAPYYHFNDVGRDTTRASRKGGRAPMGPKSDETRIQTDQTRRTEP